MRSSKYNSPNSLSSPITGNTFPSCSIRVGNEPFLKTSVSSPSSSPKSVAMMKKVMRSKQRQRPYYGNQNRNTNSNNKCSNNNNKRKNKFAANVDESNDTFDREYKSNENDKATNYGEEANNFTFKTKSKRISNYKCNAKQYHQEKEANDYTNNDSSSSNNKKWTHDDDDKKRNRKFGWRRKMSHQRFHGNFDRQQKEQIPSSQEQQQQQQQTQKEQSELLREFVKQIEDRKHNNNNNNSKNNNDTVAVSNQLQKVETCQSNTDTKESTSSDKHTKDKTEISNKETEQVEKQRCNRQKDSEKELYSWQNNNKNNNKSNTGKWSSYNTNALASMENDAWQEETHQYDNAEESNRRKYRPRQREQRKGKRLAFSSPAHNRYRPHINFNNSSNNSKQKQSDDMENTSTSTSGSSTSKSNNENNKNSNAYKWEKKTKREQYTKSTNNSNSKKEMTRSANAMAKEEEHFVSKSNKNVNKFDYTHDNYKSSATRQRSRRRNRQEYHTPLRVMQNANNDNEEVRDMQELIEETNKEQREEEFDHNERTNNNNTYTRKNSKRNKVNNRRENLYNTAKYDDNNNIYNNSRRYEEKKYVEYKVKSNSRSTFQLQNYQNKKYVDGQESIAKAEDEMKNEDYCNSAELELIVREFTSSMASQEKQTPVEHKINTLQTTKDKTDVSTEMKTGIDNRRNITSNNNKNTITSETKTTAVSTATAKAEVEWLPPMPSVMTEKEIELSRRGLRVSAPEFRPHSAPNTNEVGADYNYVNLAEFQQFPCMPAYPASNWQGAMMPPTELLYANYQEGQVAQMNSVTVDTNNNIVNENEIEEDQGWRVTSSSSIKESNVMQAEESIKPFISQRYRFKGQRHFPTASPTSITSDSQVMSNDGSPLYDFTSPISINDVSKLSEHSKWQQTSVRDYTHMDLPQTSVNENEINNANNKAVCNVYEENDSTMPTLCVNASVSHHANQDQVLHNDDDNVRHHCVQMSDVVAKNEELMFDLLVDLPLTYTETPQIHNICDKTNNVHSQEVIETNSPVNVPEHVQSKMNDNSSINALFTPTTTTKATTLFTKAGQSVGKDAHELHCLVSTESLFTPPPPPSLSAAAVTTSCVTYTEPGMKRAEQEIHVASTVEEAAAANNNIEYAYLDENEDEDEVEEAVWCGAASELQNLAQPWSFEPPQKLAPGGGYWSEEYQMNERSPSRAASVRAHKHRQPMLASPSLPTHISHTQLPTDASRQLSYTSYAPTSTSSERQHTSELTPSQYQSPTSMTTPQISLSLQNITLGNSQLEPYSASHNLSSLLLQQSTSAGSPSSMQQRAQKRYAWSMFSFNKDDEEDEQDIDAATDVNEWEINSSAYEDSLDEAQVQWIEEQLRANENPDGYFGE